MTSSAQKFHGTYFQAFLMAVVLCWSPFNLMAYFAPFFFLLWVMLRSGSQIVVRNVVLITLSWLSILLFYKVIYRDFVVGNGMLAFLTYGSFFPLLAIPSKYLANRDLLWRMLRVVAAVVVLESTLGLVQAFYGTLQTGGFDLSNGDYVEGTIHPALITEGSFSNPMFAAIMATSLTFLLSYYFISGRGKGALILGFFVFVLASVLHVIVFLLGGFVIAFLLFRPKWTLRGRRLKGIYILVIVLALMPVGMGYFLSSNVANLIPVAAQILSQRYPKTAVMFRFYTEVPEDYAAAAAPYIGLGPGQYASRASFMGTGMYFFGGPMSSKRSNIPFTAMSAPFELFVEDLWIDALTNPAYGSSSTAKPQSSWNAVLSEFGLVGSALLLLILGAIMVKVKRHIRNETDRFWAFSFGTSLTFIFLLGFQENYWEVTQAIFIGLLLMKTAYAILVHTNQVEPSVC